MRKIYFLIITVFLASNVFSQNDDWLHVAKNTQGDTVWEAKKGTYEVIKNKAGEDIGVVVGRVQNNKNDTVQVQKWYVRISDCANDMGKIVTLDISGKFLFDNDFVVNGGNIASARGAFICNVHKYVNKQNDGKGL